MKRAYLATIVFLALFALPGEVRAQTINVTNSPCTIVVVGKGNSVKSEGCDTPPPNLAIEKPKKKGKPRRLIVDKEWVFTNPENSIDFAGGDIVFKRGGKIRVHGGKLVIKARTIKTEGDGAMIEIDGTGDAGSNGGDGVKGFGGGFEPGCHPSCTGRTNENGRCVWPTNNEGDYIDANVACDHKAGHCDRGKKGGAGSHGEDGATIEVRVKVKPKNVTWTWTAAGGARGTGGAGGLGMRHEHDGDHHHCPDGPRGDDGQPGTDGSCKLFVGRKKPAECK